MEEEKLFSLLFDAHAHLPALEGANHPIIISGYSPKSNAEILERFSNPKNDNFNAFFTLGMAPQEIQREEIYPNMESAIEEVKVQIDFALSNPLLAKKFAGIGEVGLDRHWGKYPKERERQFLAFEKMIELSKQKNLRLIIHSRDAEGDCIRQLAAAGCKKVLMHCFGGTLQEAKWAAEHGWLISIPPVPNSERRKVIRALELSNFTVESDAPYIAKTSGGALEAAKIIARYREIPLEEVVAATSENVKIFLGIKK